MRMNSQVRRVQNWANPAPSEQWGGDRATPRKGPRAYDKFFYELATVSQC